MRLSGVQCKSNIPPAHLLRRTPLSGWSLLAGCGPGKHLLCGQTSTSTFVCLHQTGMFGHSWSFEVGLGSQKGELMA